MTYVMWGMLAWCCVVGAVGMNITISGNDAAGNGMATGMVRGMAGAALVVAGTLAGFYLLIRWTPFRYLCLTLLGLVSFLMMLML
jgi:hypothetical protein